MKIILFVLIILLTGCSNSHNLNITNIQTISYNDINLIENDFQEVLNRINNLEFEEGKVDGNIDNQLKIVSDKKIYDLKIYNNLIFYQEDNKTYVADNINNLNKILNTLEQQYTDFSFFETNYSQCEINENNFVIKLDSTNNCLIINTDKIIYNLRINSITAMEDYLIEDNLLYQKEEIKSNNIIIKSNILKTPTIKVSFNTEYNYTISMLPIYNEESKEIDFNISTTQKK